MSYRDDQAALRKRVDQLEAELAQPHADQDRTRELETQLARARSNLTRLADAPARRKRWIWSIAIAVALAGGSLASLYVVVSLGRSARNAWSAPPESPESLAVVDLGCPREELSAHRYGESQKVVTGCGKCAHCACPAGGIFGCSRVIDPAALKYTCGP